MQVDEGHSITPPIPNGLLTESSMELIERDGELLSPLLPTLFLDRPSIKQHALLGKSSQAGHAERHRTESNSPTHAFLKERPHHGGQITFPAGF